MVRRFCGKCGAPLRLPLQKFCTSCGAPVPPEPEAALDSSSPSRSGVPRWILAIGGIAIVAVVCAVIIVSLPQMAPGVLSSGPAGGQAGLSPVPSTGAPLAGHSPVPMTSAPTATTIPAPAARTPATPIPTVETTLPITTIIPVTPVPTEIPVTLQPSQITLAVTQVPPQPPASSYASSTPGAPALDPAAIEARIHELINIQREQNGLAPLSYDPFLADIARGQSWDMVIRHFFDHVNPDGKNPRARGDAAGYPCIRNFKSYETLGIAENLFQGMRYSAYTTTNGVVTSYDWNSQEQVADTAVSGWMNSSGHRKNILTDTFQLEGIGVAFAPDDKIYVTENFC